MHLPWPCTSDTSEKTSSMLFACSLRCSSLSCISHGHALPIHQRKPPRCFLPAPSDVPACDASLLLCRAEFLPIPILHRQFVATKRRLPSDTCYVFSKIDRGLQE